MAKRAMSGGNPRPRPVPRQCLHSGGRRRSRSRSQSQVRAEAGFPRTHDALVGRNRPTLLVGDFNIAPLECDVYDHKALLKVVSHTPVEVEALGRLAAAHDWVDLGRKHIPAPERNYSWWSYRSYWRAKDQRDGGSTTWASPEVAARSQGHRFVEETRRWEQPSDHIPLITGFAA
jgi:exodeoxyribonuclease-3